MVWLTASSALQSYRSGRLPLSPPTFRLLEELSPIEHLEALKHYGEGRQVRAVLPKYLAGPPATVLMPWDPDYAAAEGEGIAHIQGAVGSSRMEMRDGLWHSL